MQFTQGQDSDEDSSHHRLIGLLFGSHIHGVQGMNSYELAFHLALDNDQRAAKLMC